MNDTIALSVEYLSRIAEPVINRVLVALIVLLIGLILGRVAGRLVQKCFQELSLNSIFRKTTGINTSIEDIIGYGVRYTIYLLFVIIALNQLGLTSPVLVLLSGAVLVIVIILIFLGIKDFIPNFISGLMLHRRGFITEGDLIQVSGMEGNVIGTTLLETRIKTKKGDIIAIPNVVLTRNEVVKKRHTRQTAAHT